MLQPPARLTVEHAKPSYRTWAILLSVFIWHRRPAAAEKIKEMMAKHQVPYNDVTWNLIINGYANAQKVPETAAAMKAMEAQGFALDSYTMKSLRYLRDPERLWVAVDELDRAAQEADSVRSPTTQDSAAVEDAMRDEMIEKGLQKLGDKNKSKD
jgi:pentatricopeptide repeat protein